MRVLAAVLALLGLALGFGLGRFTAPGPPADLADLDSFRRGIAERDWLNRSFRMSGFLLNLGPENLPGAVEALDAHREWLNTDDLRLFMLAWCRFDPEGALSYGLSWPKHLRRNSAGAAIYAWAFRDPDGARRALQTVDDPDLKKFMETRLVAGWAHGPDWRGVSEFIAGLPEGRLRLQYMGTLAWELSKRGPDAVTSWAEAVPEVSSRFKNGAFLKAAEAVAATDVERAANWVRAHLDEPYAEGAVSAVVQRWAATDPPAAMAWLAELPPGLKRDANVELGFRVWQRRTPEPAERWLRAATPARTLDPAVRVMVSQTRVAAPAEALGWARAIDDPELRERVSASVARAWLRSDPEAARAGLAEQEMEIPPEADARP
jgi:hypothetical protein